ncbi:hypothetical protein DIPPA_21541, partial [Diplonema papillatum]
MRVVRDTTDHMRDRLWRRLQAKHKEGQQYDLVIIWGGIYDLFSPTQSANEVAQNLMRMHHKGEVHLPTPAARSLRAGDGTARTEAAAVQQLRTVVARVLAASDNAVEALEGAQLLLAFWQLQQKAPVPVEGEMVRLGLVPEEETDLDSESDSDEEDTPVAGGGVAKKPLMQLMAARILEVNEMLTEFAQDRRKKMAVVDVFKHIPHRTSPVVQAPDGSGYALPQHLGRLGPVWRSGQIEFSPLGYDRVAELIYKKLKHIPGFLHAAIPD